MAKYKAYPEYKDSGVEWLGEVPLNWQIHSLKRAVEGCTNGVWGGEPDDKHDLIVLRVADFDRQSFKISDLKLTTRSILPKDRGSRLLKQGDLLIEKSGGGDKTLVGCVVLFDKKYEAVTSNFVAKMTPRDSYDGHFLTYAFSQLYAGKVNYPSIKQTTGIQNLDADSYLMEKFCFPPKHEQRNIACFLDHETAKIDNLIEKQQQLIELLKEKRQAVISHAVTKGLNPDVPMKDSGVEWLGEVPKHWKCGYLRWYISVSSGTYLNNKDFETDESNDCINPVIGGNGVMGFTSKINDENCLIVGRVGALCGNVHQIRRACWVTDNALKISYGCDFDVDYLEMYLKVLDLNKLANHNAQPLITGTMIKEQVAIIPSIDEQKNITKFIQSKVGKIDLLIQKSSEAVDKIKERRTALISAAVTGKIDVRDWVAPDTQDVEEPQEAIA